MKLFVLDNYDSFTYNLVQRFGELQSDLEVIVKRNDTITPAEIAAIEPDRIVISPGPCTPKEAGVSNDIVRELAGTIPILGVCLGHQCIGYSFGAEVVRADSVMHGKVSEMEHTGTGIFNGVPNPFTATRYHSLLIKPDTLPDCFEVSARVKGGEEIMAIQHREMALTGLQFHPESFLTEAGYQLLNNFLKQG
jgi:anthranilate synthase/aminodeoxychorismate synthase-like glutamine amidotransferase